MFAKVMNVAKVMGGLLLNCLAVAVIYVFFAAMGYHFTSSRFIDTLFAGIATALVVMMAAWYNRRPNGGGPATKTFLTALTLFALASPSSASAAWDRGGVKVSDNPRGLPGCSRVEVWYNGYAPVGAYFAYRFKMDVDWCYTYRDGYWRYTRKPHIQAIVDNEAATARFDKILEPSITRQYNCRIEGRYTKNGCFHIYRRAQVTHTIPPSFGGGFLYGTPAVSVKINAKGDVIMFWWKSPRIPI